MERAIFLSATVSPIPLLNKRCNEGGRQTAHKAYKPGDIDSVVRCQWMKGRVRRMGSEVC